VAARMLERREKDSDLVADGMVGVGIGEGASFGPLPRKRFGVFVKSLTCSATVFGVLFGLGDEGTECDPWSENSTGTVNCCVDRAGRFVPASASTLSSCVRHFSRCCLFSRISLAAASICSSSVVAFGGARPRRARSAVPSAGGFGFVCCSGFIAAAAFAAGAGAASSAHACEDFVGFIAA
jgi:hypothetical protein